VGAAGLLLQLDGFQSHKAINRRTRTSGGPTEKKMNNLFNRSLIKMRTIYR